MIYLPTQCDKSKFHKLLIFLKGYGQFASLLARREVSALHAHVASRSSFLRKSVFIMSSFVAGKPVIFHLHGGEFMQYYAQECGPLRKWLIRFILDHCAVVVVLSRAWQVILARITKSRNVVCIPNPVLFQTPNKLRSPRESRTLLFLGRVKKEKGLYDLFEAVAKLSIQFPDLRIFAGGDGNIKELSEHAGQLRIQGRVTFFGWVEGDQKQDLLARATIFVLPSYNEALPVAILEAMAVGLPIISTTVGGIPDAVENGVEGLLIAPGNVDALVTAIAKLLLDPELRQQMGEAAVRKVRGQFSSDRIIRRIETLYTNLGAMPVSTEHPANLS
jgi:glycosyltransferase involved in cell wall biosynthesis